MNTQTPKLRGMHGGKLVASGIKIKGYEYTTKYDQETSIHECDK